MESLLEIGLKTLTVLSAGGAAIGAIGTIIATMMALRAKRRAQAHFFETYHDQLALFDLKDRPAESLTKEEVEKLSRMIEESISSMSKSDRRLIKQGLHQSNPAGVRNYIREVAAAA